MTISDVGEKPIKPGLRSHVLSWTLKLKSSSDSTRTPSSWKKVRQTSAVGWASVAQEISLQTATMSLRCMVSFFVPLQGPCIVRFLQINNAANFPSSAPYTTGKFKLTNSEQRGKLCGGTDICFEFESSRWKETLCGIKNMILFWKNIILMRKARIGLPW